jgi:hypothetical protein
MIDSPLSSDVQKLRERIQTRKNLGITKAQELCASLVHTSLRSWQHWERGERKIHLAMWELVNMKIIELENDEVKKALTLTKEEALEAIKTLQEQLDIGIEEPRLVVEWND